MEGLPDQRPRPAQDHDARRGRVHPPLPPARAAERLPPHPHPPLASSPAKNPVVFAPTENNARHRPPKPHQRSVRDPKIPIGRAAPNQTAPFPTRGFFLTRLSDADPASSPARLQRAGVRNPSAGFSRRPAKRSDPREGSRSGRSYLTCVNAD